MAITPKSIKLLWAAAGGRCSFPDCWERLTLPETDDAAPFTIGEMAHISGDKPKANRHDANLSQKERDDYRNLILLCPTHHTLIDCKENEGAYSVARLLEMKARHESKVLQLLEQPQTSRNWISTQILELLEQNRQSWLNYGPTSELAKREPHNESAHAVWIAERLSVIVPNNRKIVEILDHRKAVFRSDEQDLIAAFLIHARSYERWVRDEIPYEAVVRFPGDFDDMIRNAVDAGA